MAPLSEDSDLEPDTETAFPRSWNSGAICDSDGPTDKREDTLLAGLMTSNAAKWWREVKSFEITVGNIFCSAIVATSLLLLMAWVIKRQGNLISMYGRNYQIAGLAKTTQDGKEIFMPIYTEVK